MGHLLDIVVVALVVAASVGYAAFKLGPKSFRREIAQWLIGLAARSARVPGLNGFTHRLSAGAAAKLTAGACGGCDNCASESPTKPAASAAEVRIPVARIRRRAQWGSAGENR
jgi:uncharacterized membrane protein